MNTSYLPMKLLSKFYVDKDRNATSLMNPKTSLFEFLVDNLCLNWVLNEDCDFSTKETEILLAYKHPLDALSKKVQNVLRDEKIMEKALAEVIKDSRYNGAIDVATDTHKFRGRDQKVEKILAECAEDQYSEAVDKLMTSNWNYNRSRSNILNVSIKSKIDEAKRRIKALGLAEAYNLGTEREKVVMISKGNRDKLESPSLEETVAITKVEQKYDAHVFLVIENEGFNSFVSYVLISDNPDEWDEEYRFLQDGYLFAYTQNEKYPDLSELGDIIVEVDKNNKPVRIG